MADRSGQLMLDGVAGGGAARGHLDFAINGGEVGVDRARTDDELLGDLRIGEALCEQAQHLDLACGQVIGIDNDWFGWGSR